MNDIVLKKTTYFLYSLYSSMTEVLPNLLSSSVHVNNFAFRKICNTWIKFSNAMPEIFKKLFHELQWAEASPPMALEIVNKKKI